MKTCGRCGKGNLFWKQENGKWKLVEQDGKIHVCDVSKKKFKPETNELIEGDETIFILKNKATGLYYTGDTKASNDPKDAKQFSKLELLNKRTVFEEAYWIVGYHSV